MSERAHDIACELFRQIACEFQARQHAMSRQEKFTLGVMMDICEMNVRNLTANWRGTYQPADIQAALAKGEK